MRGGKAKRQNAPQRGKKNLQDISNPFSDRGSLNFSFDVKEEKLKIPATLHQASGNSVSFWKHSEGKKGGNQGWGQDRDVE